MGYRKKIIIIIKKKASKVASKQYPLFGDNFATDAFNHDFCSFFSCGLYIHTVESQFSSISSQKQISLQIQFPYKVLFNSQTSS